MKTWVCAFAVVRCALGISAEEFEVAAIEKNGTLTWASPGWESNGVYRVEWASSPSGPWCASWEELVGIVATGPATTVEVPMFYRVGLEAQPQVGVVPIPAGTFTMGDALGDAWWEGQDGNWYNPELPLHTVTLSPFYMGETEVTKAEWDEVYNWAVGPNGYEFAMPGDGKGPDHPVCSIEWYDAVKWCNARSEKEGLTPCYYTDAAKTPTHTYRAWRVGIQNDWVRWDANGYRLPTEAEWEYAARGGTVGSRFPWSDSDKISHDRANYCATVYYPYDESHPAGYHPDYDTDPWPYTSPVGSFAPNGYGLYDMAGNVKEWCWDLGTAYTSSPVSNPHGPDSAINNSRAFRGGNFGDHASWCRIAYRCFGFPNEEVITMGFRVVRTAP